MIALFSRLRSGRKLMALLAAAAFVSGLVPLTPARSAPLPARVATIRLSGLAAASVPSPAPIPFTMVGLTWRGGAAGAAGPSVRIRTSGDGASWSDWLRLEGEPDDAPDRGSAEDKGRRSLGPVWTGPARYVEVDGDAALEDPLLHVVDTSGASASTGQRLTAMWKGTVSPPQAAHASTNQPTIVTRAQWGADESLRDGFAGYAKAVQVAFVHHTAGNNIYAPSDSPGIIRGIYAYHVEANGWRDLGYNFLIDRYGTVFEGRWGGLDKGVIGAQTAGFNSHSTGVALMGTFSNESPPQVMVDALQTLLAWKLDVHHVDPLGSSDVVAAAGTDDFQPGESVRLRNISGHRDGSSTDCPGATVYARLPGIANVVAGLGLPKIYGGRSSPDPVPMRTDQTWPPVAFSASFTSPAPWQLTVNSPDGRTLKTASGQGTAASVTWEPVDGTGSPLAPGDYPYSLTAGPGFRAVSDTISLGPPADFDTYILVGNPGTTAASVRLDLSTPAGTVTTHTLQVPALSRRTIYLNDVLPHTELSTHLSSDVPVVAERSMYFDYKGTITGGSDAVGATAPARAWYFAEGYTSAGFEEYVTLQNPNLAPTIAGIDYMFPGGTTMHRDVPLKATSRTTISVNQDVGPEKEVSVRVTSGLPIVAERPMYYQTDRWKGGDDIVGVTSPSRTWLFAEGYTGDGFDEWLTVQNPTLTPTTYTVTYMDGDGRVSQSTHQMAAQARDTVDVRKEAGAGKEVSVRIDSAVPVVAERPMYFTYKGSIRDGHNSTGVAAPGTHYYFAEGYTGADFDQYYTVLNPGDAATIVTFRYLLEAGSPVVRTHEVAPHSRATFNVSNEVGRNHEVSAVVDSTAPVVVERPMYFDYYGVWDGGHVALGVSQPSTDWYFAEGFTG